MLLSWLLVTVDAVDEAVSSAVSEGGGAAAGLGLENPAHENILKTAVPRKFDKCPVLRARARMI